MHTHKPRQESSLHQEDCTYLRKPDPQLLRWTKHPRTKKRGLPGTSRASGFETRTRSPVTFQSGPRAATVRDGCLPWFARICRPGRTTLLRRTAAPVTLKMQRWRNNSRTTLLEDVPTFPAAPPEDPAQPGSRRPPTGGIPLARADEELHCGSCAAGGGPPTPEEVALLAPVSSPLYVL